MNMRENTHRRIILLYAVMWVCAVSLHLMRLKREGYLESFLRDTNSEKLEDRLGDILVTLYEKAEENRIAREAHEEA